jgi:CHAD domain-containing protein
MPETMAELARTTFASLQETIFSHEVGAQRGEVEAIHDMRVTTRRLRVALSNFAVCFSREASRELKSRLEEIADALGHVRDLDVLLEALATLSAESPAARKAMTATLPSRLRRRRRYHLRKLEIYFKSENYQSLRKAVQNLIDSIGVDAAGEDGKTVQNQESLAR